MYQSAESVIFTIDNNHRLSPNTNFIASLLSSIKDEDGNHLDCSNSKGVDENCEWNFSTSGITLNPIISLNPTSGPVATLVTVTGSGFAPVSTVAITFDGSTVVHRLRPLIEDSVLPSLYLYRLPMEIMP